MEAKVEILWNSLLLTWSYDYRVAGIHTFDKDGLAIGENLIERLNLETSWGTVTILETTDTSITSAPRQSRRFLHRIDLLPSTTHSLGRIFRMLSAIHGR